MMNYFKSWTLIRWIYASLGAYLAFVSMMDNQWIAALFSTYIAAMGIGGFGCAAGNCATNASQAKMNHKADQLHIDYLEIKSKFDGNKN